MLIYGFLPEITIIQSLVAFTAGTLLFLAVKDGQNYSRLLLVFGFAGIALSLFSISIGAGSHSGMQFREKFGWPVSSLTVLRDIEPPMTAAVPNTFHFNAIRYSANSAFWGIESLLIYLAYRKKRNIALFLLLALVPVYMVLGFVWFNSIPISVKPATTSSATSGEPKFRSAIEMAYPEFRDFENQPSFAGHSVDFLIAGGDEYYAFMVNGSGLPIVKATCFRVDRSGRVYETGTFPDPLDSYAGYPRIDPRNCRGIK